MPLAFDFLQRVVNVQWGEEEDFLICGNSLFAPVINLGDTSLDGEIWKPLDGLLDVGPVAYGENVWFVRHRRSTDLKSWETTPIPGMRGIAYGKPKGTEGHGLFVACSDSVFSDRNQAFVSDDLGKTFSSVGLGFDLDAEGAGMRASTVSFANDAFYIGSQAQLNSTLDAGDPYPKLWRSVNGHAWTSVSMFTGLTPYVYSTAGSNPNYKPGAIGSVAGDSKSEKLCVVGQMTLNPLNGSQPWLCSATSSNGTTWSGGTSYSGYGALHPQAVAFGNGLFVVVGGQYYPAPLATAFQNAVIFTSSTGSSFSPAFVFHAPGSNGQASFIGVAFSKTAKNSSGKSGKFVAIGQRSSDADRPQGLLFSSADGSSWTSHSVNLTEPLQAISGIGIGKLPSES
jgi:hypothetical protein